MKCHLAVFLFLGLTQSLFADTQTNERLEHFLSLSFEELVSLETSIATATKKTLKQAPAVVTVITSDDFKTTGATNLVDILQGVPGIYIRTDTFNNRPLIHFRGARATQTLLMVNGKPMKDLMWVFGIFWKGLPVSIIERVEIIRGPGSALFGADATAGVINVITKTAGKIESSEAGVRVGSFDTKSAWIQHGAQLNGFEIGFTADLSKTGGYSPLITSDRQTQQDQNYNPDVSYAPDNASYGWNSEDIRLSIARGNWRLHTDYVRHSNMEIGLTGAGVLDPVTRASDNAYNIDLFYNNQTFNNDWVLSSELRYKNLEYSSGSGFQERPPGFVDASGAYPDGQINHMQSAERQLAFEISGLYSGIQRHALRLGAGYTLQDLYYVEQWVNSGLGPDGIMLPAGSPLVNVSDSPYAFAPEKIRKIRYFFLQDIWSISNDWELTAGARYDHYSDFGHAINPRLALVWQSTDKLTSKLMYGQAFRAPAYQELFSETSRALPNDQLDAERSQTLDLSFSYAASNNLQLSMNLFYVEQTDIIQAINVVGVPKKQFQNTGDHMTEGIEFEVQWQVLDDLRILANYAIQNPENDEFQYFQVPEKTAYARADWGFLPKWNWSLQSNWFGKRPRPSTDSHAPLDSYFMTDTTFRYAGQKNIELVGSIRNLFDIDAREYSTGSIEDDLALPDRNVYIEMRYKF